MGPCRHHTRLIIINTIININITLPALQLTSHLLPTTKQLLRATLDLTLPVIQRSQHMLHRIITLDQAATPRLLLPKHH